MTADTTAQLARRQEARELAPVFSSLKTSWEEEIWLGVLAHWRAGMCCAADGSVLLSLTGAARDLLRILARGAA